MDTPNLIATLAAELRPVRRLRHPLVRAAAWLTFAAMIVGLLAVGHGIRPDLAQRLQQPAFAIGLAASLLTGVLAAISSFVASLPDRSRFWSLLPIPALGVWASTIGYGCLMDWVDIGPDGIHLGETVRCFATLVLTSSPLSVVLLVMLRHAAVLRPEAVAVSGSLAVAAVTATSLSLLHSLDATIMVLIWNLGSAALIVSLGALFGRRLFSWVGPRRGLQ